MASIRAERLALDVPIYLQVEREVRGWGDMFLGAAFDPPSRRTMRLLDDISFSLGEGDRLAILGRNGAGKSTLLRVLNRVYQPTQGMLQIEGSCQALLNMGLGFSNEATVRENIYLRGIAMGLKTGFLRQQVQQILEFAGLQEKASHRLRTLSSGQRMRLGFAISTSVQHDIMLMDEWVGAGDAEFMAKAKERMQSRVGGSKIVVLASHSVGLLRAICNKGIVLERGRLVHAGDIVSSLKAYHDLLASLRDGGGLPEGAQAAEGPLATTTYGCVENIEIVEGAMKVRGWCVNSDGSVPTGLAVVLDGVRHPVARVEQYPRPDVARHMGLSDSTCGFVADFPIAGGAGKADPGFQVLAGSSADQAQFPLRIAASVQVALAQAMAPEDAATGH